MRGIYIIASYYTYQVFVKQEWRVKGKSSFPIILQKRDHGHVYKLLLIFQDNSLRVIEFHGNET